MIEMIGPVWVVFVIRFDDSPSNDFAHSFFDKNNITRFHFVSKLPRRVGGVFVRSVSLVDCLHLLANGRFRRKFAQVANLTPTEKHDALLIAFVPFFCILTWSVTPIMNRWNLVFILRLALCLNPSGVRQFRKSFVRILSAFKNGFTCVNHFKVVFSRWHLSICFDIRLKTRDKICRHVFAIIKEFTISRIQINVKIRSDPVESHRDVPLNPPLRKHRIVRFTKSFSIIIAGIFRQFYGDFK